MRRRSSAGGSRLMAQIVIGLVIAGFALVSFLGSKQYNSVTGEDQYISLTTQQEIALGLQSAPQMIQQYGGAYPDDAVQKQIDDIGFNIVDNSIARNTDWPFEFTVLDDPSTVNAFALPGGQVFITYGLLSKLDTQDEVAGVLSHEITHVLARHGAQQIAKGNLTSSLVNAVAVASGSANTTQTAAMIAQLVNLHYGRGDETQADTIGVCLMMDAGYDPQGMVDVMHVLESVSGGAQQPEFFSTHPNPENRIQAIQTAIADAPQRCKFVN